MLRRWELDVRELFIAVDRAATAALVARAKAIGAEHLPPAFALAAPAASSTASASAAAPPPAPGLPAEEQRLRRGYGIK